MPVLCFSETIKGGPHLITKALNYLPSPAQMARQFGKRPPGNDVEIRFSKYLIQMGIVFGANGVVSLSQGPDVGGAKCKFISDNEAAYSMLTRKPCQLSNGLIIQLVICRGRI